MYPDAYIDYLVYFHADRDLFECHEVLEEYWKQLSEKENSDIWVALIQIAVGLYHQRRGNGPGAHKMLNSALSKLRSEDVEALGLDKAELLAQLEMRLMDLNGGSTELYVDFNLPIKSPELLDACLMRAAERKVTWLSPSNLANEYLMNKHTLRDRSGVIKTRYAQLAKRRSREK
ncbi:DUF309 domain-containing protein [Aneurinibacillus sp. Ricciae_BoGa-3]|uniref:DUF309 domain-containing protein n=1 Tax=Aneurinibacillus sp. Ricciae_BoGa-3 TaxID=3022697 RepID=UPI002341D191|nr:DUF309 domain-containing protein [Aneurinibacillus sp. Ricciae_BoGa-3]WCK56222.1 DUF309 domain-containing protein [Aneurinibacillus sp. Ricciae_BoGa-3]